MWSGLAAFDPSPSSLGNVSINGEGVLVSLKTKIREIAKKLFCEAGNKLIVRSCLWKLKVNGIAEN